MHMKNRTTGIGIDEKKIYKTTQWLTNGKLSFDNVEKPSNLNAWKLYYLEEL